jgi:hypothetical protein
MTTIVNATAMLLKKRLSRIQEDGAVITGPAGMESPAVVIGLESPTTEKCGQQSVNCSNLGQSAS